MDGGHDIPEINLRQEMFWPDNIVDLFVKYGVKKRFDFLSVDVDGYDWFVLESILLAGYSPRVVMAEYNANFDPEDSKSIRPPDKGRNCNVFCLGFLFRPCLLYTSDAADE